jgi:hypothetical protein
MGMITIVLILAVAFLTAATTAVKRGMAHRSAIRAFQLAEAGVDKALAELNSHLGVSGEVYLGEEGVPLGAGTFTVKVYELASPDEELVKSRVQIVSNGTVNGLTKRIEVIAEQPQETIDADLYDKALVSEDFVVGTNSSQCIVDGGIWYRNTIEDVGHGPTYPDATWDVMPDHIHLPQFDFGQLDQFNDPTSGLMLVAYQQEQEDGLRHFFLTADDLNANKHNMPSSFWFDEENQIPNVIYITDSINLSGNYEMGGLIIVRGTTQIEQDASFGGNNTIYGVIFTHGRFNMHGGGNQPMNIIGGVFCGSASLKGQPNLTYNEEYMRAVESFAAIRPRYVPTSWREL